MYTKDAGTKLGSPGVVQQLFKASVLPAEYAVKLSWSRSSCHAG